VGSNPTLSAFSFYLQANLRIGCRQAERSWTTPESYLLQPYCNPLRKNLLHGVGSLIAYARQHVRVGVQGHGYGGVTQEFLHEFGVHALAEQ